MATPETKDPYAPPPRHKDKSGPIVRVALLGAMLAGAAWGYMSFANAPETASLAPVAEEQTFAEARAPDGSYRVNTPQTLEPAATARPAPSSAPQQPVAPTPEPVPPPSTAIAPTAPAPLPPIDSPSGD